MSLTDTVALVTGGASGIGRAAAIALAARGARVIVTDIDTQGGGETVAAIGAAARFMPHDVAEEPEWQAVIASIRDSEGRLDTLVNNAGIGSGMLVTDMPLEMWNRQLAINLTGVFLGCKHAIPLIRAGGRGGSIVNISSVAGLQGSAGLAGYCATKGGVRLMTKAIAKECAAAKDGIRVNSVHPGIIDTPIWSKINEGGLDSVADAFSTPGANTLNADLIAASGTPLGHAGAPEDIANGIVFLAGPESRYMTGSELVIDGGWTA
ncbi:SDR family oxidoreductase [Sandaracinobacteroides saxicola]|uniref:SDR family oxidoreductase n=1 Tax=Sandaracinobacteroides saxicola TaxID=2759707 RepID=A0A7G5IIY6_9SPHN|nr:SDR family oxidoreductase [Sandaracinobacteroides saxicola]QMW23328.1 SDR family oxidoreductase [Sandaracinobacteroides saxicola]